MLMFLLYHCSSCPGEVGSKPCLPQARLPVNRFCFCLRPPPPSCSEESGSGEEWKRLAHDFWNTQLPPLYLEYHRKLTEDLLNEITGVSWYNTPFPGLFRLSPWSNGALSEALMFLEQEHVFLPLKRNYPVSRNSCLTCLEGPFCT